MPWLYFGLSPKLRAWAEPWQAQVQAELRVVEKVVIGAGCVLAATLISLTLLALLTTACGAGPRVTADPARDAVIAQLAAARHDAGLPGAPRRGPPW